MPLSYQERYDTSRPSYTRTNEKQFADLPAGTSILIPSPQDIESTINELAPHERLGLTELRQKLAMSHGADGACPVMTGMNLRVVAELAFEALDAGVLKDDVVPVWQVIEPKTPLAKKLPGGPDRIQELRDARPTT